MKYPQGITGRTAGAALQFWASVPSFTGTVVPSDRRFGDLDQAPRIVLERSPCARRPVRTHGAQKGENMPQKAFTAISALLLLAGLALPAADTMAQGAKQLVGAWDTPKSASYGENARGLLIFTADGHYQLSIQRATLPKIASNNRTKGTPQEDHAVVEGSINHFGRYTVDDKKKTVTFHIEGSTFPNWIGTTQERPYTITGDVLVYKVAVVSGTGQPGETGWKRAKK